MALARIADCRAVPCHVMPCHDMLRMTPLLAAHRRLLGHRSSRRESGAPYFVPGSLLAASWPDNQQPTHYYQDHTRCIYEVHRFTPACPGFGEDMRLARGADPAYE